MPCMSPYLCAAVYHDIQRERARLRLVDRAALAQALGVDVTDLAEAHRTWGETAVRAGRGSRAPRWTESVAVGSRGFVDQGHRDLGGTGRHRAIEPDGEGYRLRDEEEFSGGHSAGKMTSVRRISA